MSGYITVIITVTNTGSRVLVSPGQSAFLVVAGRDVDLNVDNSFPGRLVTWFKSGQDSSWVFIWVVLMGPV